MQVSEIRRQLGPVWRVKQSVNKRTQQERLTLRWANGTGIGEAL